MSAHQAVEGDVTEQEKRVMGRPKLPDEVRRDSHIRIRVTAKELQEYEAVGGLEWFRRTLRRAAARLKGGKSGG